VKVPTGFRYENVSIDALPATVDWRTKGAVTPIRIKGNVVSIYGCVWFVELSHAS
jgi:hypothetical protein